MTRGIFTEISIIPKSYGDTMKGIARTLGISLLLITFLGPVANAGESVPCRLIFDHSDKLLEEYCSAMGLYWSSDYQSAKVSFQKIIENYPEYASGYIYMGDCQQAQGETEAARESYEKAYLLLKSNSALQKDIVPDAEDPETFSDMVYCLNAMGLYDEAKKLAMLGALSGKSPDLLVNMAYSFHKLGQFEIAQSNFCKSREIVEPRELRNLTYQRLTNLFDSDLQWEVNCPDKKPQEKEGTNYALIIAVGAYKDPKINPLRYVENDARELYRVLTDPRTGLFRPENVTVLINRDATEKKMKFNFDDVIPKANQKDDLLFLFYAGHGFTYPHGADTYWLTYDTVVGNESGNRIRSTAFSNLTLATKIADLEANTILFFVDACFSSGMVNRPAAIRGLENYLGAGKDFLIITSSQADQESIESPQLKHGVFSHFLIEGLSGKADTNSDGLVSVDELWTYLKSNVSQYAMQMGTEQNPRRSGSSHGSVYLSRNPNY